MRRYLLCNLALATVVFSASTCEKMEPGDYHDYLGNKINLLGAWALTEVQVRTAGVIFTNDEWENNRGLGEDDSQYEQGKTYYFHVVDEDTISSEEKVSSNTVMVNFYTRFNGSGLTTKSSMDELYSTNTLIIMYDVEVGKDPLLAAVKEFGAEILYDYNIIPGMAVRIPDGSDIQKAIVYFKQVKGVVSVERDQIHRLTDPVRPRIETM